MKRFISQNKFSLSKEVFRSIFSFSIACNKIKRNVPTLGNGSRGDRFVNYSMDTR